MTREQNYGPQPILIQTTPSSPTKVLFFITAARGGEAEMKPETTMKYTRSVLEVAGLLAALAFLASVVVVPAEATTPSSQGGSTSAAALPGDVLMSPEDMVKVLQSPNGEKPLILYVGFHVLYAQAHIPSSAFIGPGSQREAVDKLRKRLESLSRKKFVVLYCGCCPLNHCPNQKPAYEALHNMGFTRLKVLYIPNNFGRDWMDKGYPVEKGL